MAVEWGHPSLLRLIIFRARSMASANRDRSGNYLVKFRWGKREFTKSLHTKDETVADLGVARVNDTLMRLKRGLLEMPTEAEVVP